MTARQLDPGLPGGELFLLAGTLEHRLHEMGERFSGKALPPWSGLAKTPLSDSVRLDYDNPDELLREVRNLRVATEDLASANVGRSFNTEDFYRLLNAITAYERVCQRGYGNVLETLPEFRELSQAAHAEASFPSTFGNNCLESILARMERFYGAIAGADVFPK